MDTTVMSTVHDVARTQIQGDPETLSLNDPTRFYRYEIGKVNLLSSEEIGRASCRERV